MEKGKMTPRCPTCGVDILEHPAGRCLDAWVAEKMGYQTRLVSCEYEGSFLVKENIQEYNGGYWVTLPKYSTDIAAAIVIFDRFTDATIEKSGLNYEVIISVAFSARDQKLSLAICRASILAMEAE